MNNKATRLGILVMFCEVYACYANPVTGLSVVFFY